MGNGVTKLNRSLVMDRGGAPAAKVVGFAVMDCEVE